MFKMIKSLLNVFVRKKSTQISWQQNIIKELQDSIDTAKIKNLTLEDVVSFFKQPEILAKLQEDQNRIAVALKEKTEDNSYSVILCIYSQNDATLVTPEMAAKRFEAEELSVDLTSIFGNKDMIVLQ